MKVNSEELDNYPVKNFIGKAVYNHCKPGTGKTKKIHDIIMYCLQQDLRVAVCMQQHDLIVEFRNYNNYDAIHLLGKSHFCEKHGTLEMYDPGCSECNYKQVCGYPKQFKILEDKQIAFIVPQHLFILDKYEFDVLIVDETIESLVYNLIEIPSDLIKHFDFEEIECSDCLIRESCSKKKYREKYGFVLGYCYNKVIKKPQLKNFNPETLEQYFFKITMEQLDDLYAVQVDHKWHIGGVKDMNFLDGVDTLVFNCATTDVKLAEKMFGREFNLVIEDTGNINNDIIQVDKAMTINQTENFLPNLIDFMNMFNIPMTEETLIYSKLKFENDVVDLLTDVKHGHYGESRGTNRFEGVKFMILLGRYWLRQDHRILLKMMGLSDEEVDKIAISEMEQAVHRARPALYPDVKIFLITNSLAKSELVKPTRVEKEISIKIASEIIQASFDIEGLSKTEIYHKFNHDHRDTISGLRILNSEGWINDMDKYGARLTWQRKPQN